MVECDKPDARPHASAGRMTTNQQLGDPSYYIHFLTQQATRNTPLISTIVVTEVVVNI